MARVAELEQDQAGSPAGPPDDQWLAGAASRTAVALRSGQEVAQNLVQRARDRAKEIESGAQEEAAEIRKRAEAEASRILAVAQYDAEGVLQAAQASGEELLAHARQARQQAMEQFTERRAALRKEIERLERRRRALLECYASIKRPVDEAIRLLEGERGHPGTPGTAQGLTSWWQALSAKRRLDQADGSTPVSEYEPARPVPPGTRGQPDRPARARAGASRPPRAETAEVRQ